MPEPQVIFSHSAHPDAAHDLAAPLCTVLPCQDMLSQPAFLMKAIGGLTKLEQVAAMVAANIMDSTVENVVDYAEALLAECAKRQAPKEQPSAIEVAG